MAENSKIEWTTHTFNAWKGCTKVSPGCKNCYALDWGKRFGVQWGPGATRQRTSKGYWRKPYAWNKQAGNDGIRPKIFCSSLADVFEDKPNQPEIDIWRAELFAMILDTANLDWLLLTKRPENVNRMIEAAGEWWFQNGAPGTYGKKLLRWMKHGLEYAPANVWIGTSVENQEMADKRVPELLGIPAKVRFLSMEPLLGPVELGLFDVDYPDYKDEIEPGFPVFYPSKAGQLLNWIIVGGESGPYARPMNPAWVRSIRDQCQSAGIPFLFKQWGEWIGGYHDLPGELQGRVNDGDLSQMETVDDVPMYKFGKHSTGRLLDGVEWNQSPS